MPVAGTAFGRRTLNREKLVYDPTISPLNLWLMQVNTSYLRLKQCNLPGNSLKSLRSTNSLRSNIHGMVTAQVFTLLNIQKPRPPKIPVTQKSSTNKRRHKRHHNGSCGNQSSLSNTYSSIGNGIRKTGNHVPEDNQEAESAARQ